MRSNLHFGPKCSRPGRFEESGACLKRSVSFGSGQETFAFARFPPSDAKRPSADSAGGIDGEKGVRTEPKYAPRLALAPPPLECYVFAREEACELKRVRVFVDWIADRERRTLEALRARHPVFY